MALKPIPKVDLVLPPPVLFRFRRFPSIDGLSGDALNAAKLAREHVLDTLLNHRIRLASPTSFTDPYDCHCRAVPRSDDPDEQAELLRKWSLRSARSHSVRMNMLANPARRKLAIDMAFSAVAESLSYRRAEYRILCLCADAHRPTMWSHYADAHRGICIHLDATKPPFGLAYKVSYQNEVGQYPLPITLDDGFQPYLVQQLFLIKDTNWSYEAEHRFIYSPEFALSDARDYGVVISNDFLHFPADRIVGISLGHDMDQRTKAQLLESLSAGGAKFPVYGASRSKERFEVDFKAQLYEIGTPSR